jgi:hypothetical protein
MIHHPICHTGRVRAQAWRRLPPTTVDGGVYPDSPQARGQRRTKLSASPLR